LTGGDSNKLQNLKSKNYALILTEHQNVQNPQNFEILPKTSAAANATLSKSIKGKKNSNIFITQASCSIIAIATSFRWRRDVC
jgi:hypothetical protein